MGRTTLHHCAVRASRRRRAAGGRHSQARERRWSGPADATAEDAGARTVLVKPADASRHGRGRGRPWSCSARMPLVQSGRRHGQACWRRWSCCSGTSLVRPADATPERAGGAGLLELQCTYGAEPVQRAPWPSARATLELLVWAGGRHGRARTAALELLSMYGACGMPHRKVN